MSTSTTPAGGIVMRRKDGGRLPWLAEAYASGPHKRQRKSTATQAEASAWLTEVLRKRKADPTGHRTAGGQLTFRAWCERYASTQRTWTPATRALRVWAWRDHIDPVLGAIPLADITHDDVQAVVDSWQGKLDPSTQRTTFQALTGPLRAAVKRGILPSPSPTDGVKLPEVANRSVDAAVRDLTWDRVVAIAEAMPDAGPYRMLVWLAAGTGMRASELIGITRDRVTFHEDGTATIRKDRQLVARTAPASDPAFRKLKGKRPDHFRDIAVNAYTAQRLREYLEAHPAPDSDLVFRTAHGVRVSLSSMGHAWVRNTATADLPKGRAWHLLRHWHASHLLEGGAPIAAVSEQLDHGSPVITMAIYAHATAGARGKLLAALDEAMPVARPALTLVASA